MREWNISLTKSEESVLLDRLTHVSGNKQTRKSSIIKSLNKGEKRANNLSVSIHIDKENFRNVTLVMNHYGLPESRKISNGCRLPRSVGWVRKTERYAKATKSIQFLLILKMLFKYCKCNMLLTPFLDTCTGTSRVQIGMWTTVTRLQRSCR